MTVSLEAPLRPFEYQTRLKETLQKKNKLWSWFSEDKAKKEYFENFKKELLKGSYRLDRDNHSDMYEMVDDIKTRLNLPIDITLYQELMSYQNNVAISFYKQEAHIVLSGRVMHLLDAQEMKAILAHELYHYYLFEIEEKQYEITDRIITSIANDSRSESVYLESARLFKLYTELYCDRGSFVVMEDIQPIISALVKLSTGIEKVNAESYLSQADEILKNEEKSTENLSHPEAFIRAKALSLWSEKKEDAEETIKALIEPKIEFEKLNIFSQVELKKLTNQLIFLFLKPSWNSTDRTKNLANQYEYRPILEEMDVGSFFETLEKVGDTTKKYFSYVLLDFALVDPDQGNTSLGYAFELAENGGLKDAFKRVVKKEIKLTERKFKDLHDDAISSLNEVNESKDDSLYGE